MASLRGVFEEKVLILLATMLGLPSADRACTLSTGETIFPSSIRPSSRWTLSGWQISSRDVQAGDALLLVADLGIHVLSGDDVLELRGSDGSVSEADSMAWTFVDESMEVVDSPASL